MNTKNNRRHQDTLQRIKNVFLEILQTRGLSQIKVSDICKQAQINRSTFYANFSDIYDLSDKIKIELEEEVNHLLEQEFSLEFGEEDFLRLFKHIKNNQTLYLFYFKLGYDRAEGLMLYNLHGYFDMNRELIDYHIAFFKNGFNAIVKKWLEGGCKESPQQMCDVLLYEYRGRFSSHSVN